MERTCYYTIFLGRLIMKVKELIEELSNYDGELDIGIIVSYVEHICGENSYCYCSSEDHEYYISSIDKKYKKKKIQNELKGLWIRGDI